MPEVIQNIVVSSKFSLWWVVGFVLHCEIQLFWSVHSAWHQPVMCVFVCPQALAVGGVGSIVRVLTARKTVWSFQNPQSPSATQDHQTWVWRSVFEHDSHLFYLLKPSALLMQVCPLFFCIHCFCPCWMSGSEVLAPHMSVSAMQREKTHLRCFTWTLPHSLMPLLAHCNLLLLLWSLRVVQVEEKIVLGWTIIDWWPVQDVSLPFCPVHAGIVVILFSHIILTL